jgi:hypothetical protein
VLFANEAALRLGFQLGRRLIFISLWDGIERKIGFTLLAFDILPVKWPPRHPEANWLVPLTSLLASSFTLIVEVWLSAYRPAKPPRASCPCSQGAVPRAGEYSLWLLILAAQDCISAIKKKPRRCGCMARI